MKYSSGCGFIILFFVLSFGHYLVPTSGIPGFVSMVIVGSFFCLLFWFAGNLYNTKEYHERKVPKWMVYLADGPVWWPSWEPVSTWSRSPTVNKIISVVLLISFVTGFAVLGIAKDSIGAVVVSICILIIWALGIFIIELKFRKHYTPLKKQV